MPSPTRGLTQPQRLELSARRLLEAAVALIGEKGWDATTAAEIGQRAGYSRAMVHARYGSKDALLETLFASEYEKKLSPLPDPGSDGMTQALAHLDRIALLYAEDPDLCRAVFVLTFEAAKTTSQAHPYTRMWLERAAHAVEAGLRKGIADGSVRPEVDIARAVNDFGAAVLGTAYQWIMQAYPYDIAEELAYVRARLVCDYGA
ncbi:MULTISPECIES: TetR/AcrR family transcriptional regulator [Mycolicibacterium]|uniref:TetR/AcrR family transcriptional regulator n=1 Tax=Mycolicibacterium TaxID=1866885 RepID=UPI001CA307E5|nr:MULTISPECIES: TetR/AcrR family transcriptional regulator [Mycolicibacterium]MDW5610774.1 TetR/AcrR family transcriptional regulator [Mycolicibacterium sp. D5.8-2]QZT58832.1 TetR/AcrR family transcriptional regulator [Mycolicibacterium austroafricanum]